jgi:hypothetical protein
VNELSEAYHGLLDEVRAVEQRLLDAEPALPEPDVLDGYRFAFSLLEVALEAYVWADTARPRFVDIVGPSMKWGGDNADAFYQLAALDPARTYRVRVTPGDAVYLSLTVYGGPDDGRYSERIIGTLNDRTMTPSPDGGYEVVLSPRPHDGNWIRLEPDAVFALTRDYLVDPATGTRSTWTIEADAAPQRREESRADLARRFRAARTWVAEQAALVPVRMEPANEVADPHPVPARTFGWAAGDAAYAHGSFELGEGEALVIEGTSPECAFWNLCLWTPYLHTYDYRYERVTINAGQVDHEPDGSWRIVVAPDDPGHPNWVSTAGRTSGLLWFRWFLPEATPERPRCSVRQLAEAGR